MCSVICRAVFAGYRDCKYPRTTNGEIISPITSFPKVIIYSHIKFDECRLRLVKAGDGRGDFLLLLACFSTMMMMLDYEQKARAGHK